MMGELILHIGMPKTGTTSLQWFLYENREKLARQGVLYPVFTDQPQLISLRNGVFLSEYARCVASGKDPSGRARDIEENLARLRQALSGSDRVLITNETFSRPLYRKNAKSFEYGPLWRTLAHTLEDAGATDVTIVVYLRRQDDWVSSRWRQEIKKRHEMLSLSEFCDDALIRCSLDYEVLLETARNAFQNDARLVVRPYDMTAFKGGDIFRDFCSAAGIPWDAGYRIPESDHNPSFSFDVAEAARRCTVPPPLISYWKETIAPLARELTAKYPDPPGTTPFDEEATRALMEPYLEGNRLISERYLDGEPLFSEEYGGRPVWASDEGRIAECRAAFEEAARAHGPEPRDEDALRVLARKLPEGVKRPLRAVRERLFGR